MKRLLLATVVLLLTMTGCGYHVPASGDAWAGKGGQTLYVELFGNRTVEPYLDSVVSEEVAVQLSRSRLVDLSEERGAADLVLAGTVIAFDSRAVAYDDEDRISEYVAVMTVKASLTRRSDNVVLWQDELRRSETYPAVLDKNLRKEGESLAARVVAKRIAEDLMSRLLSDF